MVVGESLHDLVADVHLACELGGGADVVVDDGDLDVVGVLIRIPEGCDGVPGIESREHAGSGHDHACDGIAHEALHIPKEYLQDHMYVVE